MAPAKYIYDADDFILDLGTPFVHYSNGGWAACSTCAALIDANDQSGLVERGYQAWRRRGLPPGDSLDLLRAIHTAFFASRRGGRRLAEPPSSSSLDDEGERPKDTEQ
jgi:hypothetical protein